MNVRAPANINLDNCLDMIDFSNLLVSSKLVLLCLGYTIRFIGQDNVF